jgi:hypothetical protein
MTPEEKAFRRSISLGPKTEERLIKARHDPEMTKWQRRLVFADWLQDRDDPRALGFRAMGVLKRQPLGHPKNWCWLGAWEGYREWDIEVCCWTLPSDWYYKVYHPSRRSEEWPTQIECEDAAALAFLELPPVRQSQLLRGWWRVDTKESP